MPVSQISLKLSYSTYIVYIRCCEYRVDEPCGDQNYAVMHPPCPDKRDSITETQMTREIRGISRTVP
jgi:hypothetical protein